MTCGCELNSRPQAKQAKSSGKLQRSSSTNRGGMFMRHHERSVPDAADVNIVDVGGIWNTLQALLSGPVTADAAVISTASGSCSAAGTEQWWMDGRARARRSRPTFGPKSRGREVAIFVTRVFVSRKAPS